MLLVFVQDMCADREIVGGGIRYLFIFMSTPARYLCQTTKKTLKHCINPPSYYFSYKFFKMIKLYTSAVNSKSSCTLLSEYHL